MINGYEINGAEINGDASGSLVLFAPVVVNSNVAFSLTSPVFVYSVTDGPEPIAPTAIVEITSALAIAPTAPVIVNSNDPFSLVAAVEVTAHLFNADANAIEWHASLSIGGVDFSARMTGRCRIERNINASTLADFDIIPASGVFNPALFDGQPVEIYYGDQRGDVLIFKGRVIRMQINQSEHTVSLTCSDLLQEKVDQLQQAQIDGLIDHARSPLIHGEADSVWDYTQQALLSAEGDFYQDRYNRLMFKAWGGAVGATHGDGQIFYNTLQPEIADRHTLVNSVDIDIEFRYVAGWHRVYHLNWYMGMPSNKWMVSYFSELPTREMIEQSIPQDLAVNNLSYYEPLSGRYEYKSVVVYFNNASPGLLAYSFNCDLIDRWLQNIRHTFSISVSAQSSIDRYGIIPASQSHRFSIDDSGIDWHVMSKSDRKFGVNMGYNEDGERIGSDLFPPDGDDVQVFNNNQVSSYRLSLFDSEHIPNTVSDAIKCSVSEARKRILESHEIYSLGYELPINPLLELTDRFSVNSLGTIMVGRVSELTHEFDFDSGSAFSRIKLTAFANTDAADISAPALIDTAPTSINVEMLPLKTWLGTPSSGSIPDDFRGFSCNVLNPLQSKYVLFDKQTLPWDGLIWPGDDEPNADYPYPVAFTLEIPPVSASERDEIEIEQTASFAVPVNLNTLSITL